MSESKSGRAGASRAGNRPQAGRPVQRSTTQPASRGPQRRSAAPSRQGAQSRSGAPARSGTQSRQGLVRPAPKAKSRKARLVISKLDPWSVLKMAFLLSVALGVVAVVASIVLWTVLDLTGIFDRMNTLIGDVGGQQMSSVDVRQIASLQQVVSFTTIISLVNIVLLTALATLAAVLYNICASLVGGVGVTLTDD